jgi:hypothetical protein
VMIAFVRVLICGSGRRASGMGREGYAASVEKVHCRENLIWPVGRPGKRIRVDG